MEDLGIEISDHIDIGPQKGGMYDAVGLVGAHQRPRISQCRLFDQVVAFEDQLDTELGDLLGRQDRQRSSASPTPGPRSITSWWRHQ
jgi:hypothetical protein